MTNVLDLKILGDCICTFGVFDGVHDGHKFLISHVINQAKKLGKKSIIITFDIDPDELFKTEFTKLMPSKNRINTLKKLDVDDVIVLDFMKIKDISPKLFLDFIFKENTPYAIHVGSNFYFGRKASGNIELLKKWGEDNNMNVYVYDLLKKNGVVISSTNIRKGIL